MGSKRKKIKKNDIDVLLILPNKSLATKLLKISKDQKKDLADIAKDILNDWFVLKGKEEIRNNKENELKEKRNMVISEVDLKISELQKKIKLLK